MVYRFGARTWPAAAPGIQHDLMSRRLFVYEYTCALGLGGASLRTEGAAMLAAVLHDCAALPGLEATTLLHSDLELPERVTVRRISPATEESAFRAAARAADFTLVIAPEFDDLLETRCRWVEEENGHLLGPSSAAVRLTGDKQDLAEHLCRAGVPTPVGDGYPAVLKPRFGAGSQATFLLQSEADLPAARARAAAEGWSGNLLRQPFVAGRAASAAFLVGPRQRIALPPAEQHLAEGRFHYLGGRLPLSPELATRARQLAERAVASVPGLRGYVGVDVVLGAAEPQDAVIEINPRLTTSYIGLRALARTNLAEAMVCIVAGEEVAEPAWHPGGVQFQADGTISVEACCTSGSA